MKSLNEFDNQQLSLVLGQGGFLPAGALHVELTRTRKVIEAHALTGETLDYWFGRERLLALGLELLAIRFALDTSGAAQ